MCKSDLAVLESEVIDDFVLRFFLNQFQVLLLQVVVIGLLRVFFFIDNLRLLIRIL